MPENESADESAIATVRETGVATPAAVPMSEIQLHIARTNPRDENQIKTRLQKELTEHPDFADEGFYSIPYKDNRKGIITFVEGLSIRAAEHVWTRWGNCTVAARIADNRGDKIMVQGMFFDYETGLLNLTDLEVPKMGKTRQGGTYPLDVAKMRLAVQSAESKVKRNAFLGGIPVWIKEGYLSMCRELILWQPKGQNLSTEERITKAEAHFTAKFKVAPADVKKFVEKVKSAHPSLTDKELLRYLIGLNNAVKDGNADIDFVFGEDREPASMPQAKKAQEVANGKETAAATTTEAGDAQES